jgi:hypothetical protein
MRPEDKDLSTWPDHTVQLRKKPVDLIERKMLQHSKVIRAVEAG